MGECLACESNFSANLGFLTLSQVTTIAGPAEGDDSSSNMTHHLGCVGTDLSADRLKSVLLLEKSLRELSILELPLR